jgi:hypothetical protein
MTVNIGDVVQVVQTWDTPLASVAQNVWHLKQISGAGSDPDDILAAVLTQQQTAFALIDQDIAQEFEAVLLELRQWDFDNDRFDGVATLAMTSMQGGSIADYSPHGVAAYGRIVTEAARRQGGTYIPGVDDTAIVSGVLESTFEAAFITYLATFDTDISVTDGLLSWCTFNVDPLSPLFETASLAAQTVIANSLPSYLSKRKPGNGL